eukprot:1189363-Amphidinium_carterae.1
MAAHDVISRVFQSLTRADSSVHHHEKVKLPSTLMFDYPTIAALASYIAGTPSQACHAQPSGKKILTARTVPLRNLQVTHCETGQMSGANHSAGGRLALDAISRPPAQSSAAIAVCLHPTTHTS